MLTSDELLDAYHGDDQHRHIHMDGAHGEGLRAVEAAVRAATLREIAEQAGKTNVPPNGLLDEVAEAARADQIEKDAAIVEGNLGRNWVIRETPRDVAAAIRAQLTETNGEH